MSVFRKDSRALITGGALGIGLAVAQHCLAASMRVTIVDNNQTTLDLAAKTLKGEVNCVKADVSDLAAWKRLKDSVGSVDFLMLNAGRMVRGTWGEDEYFKQVSQFRIYLSSAVFCWLGDGRTNGCRKRYWIRISTA
jgi:NADP-dependent 3-hydroxy acid dehydrogenase YdfG